MPVTMPHASIGEVLDIIQKQIAPWRRCGSGFARKARPCETPLDPAPASMIETLINYRQST